MQKYSSLVYRTLRHRDARDWVDTILMEAADKIFVPALHPWFTVNALEGEDLATICSDEGTFFEYFDSSVSVTLDLPAIAGQYEPSEKADMKETHSGMSIDPPYVCELSDVSLVGPHAIPIKNGEYVLEHFFGGGRRLASNCLLSTVRGQVPKRKPDERNLGTVVSLVGTWTDNYAHWFQDYLARLEGMQYFESATGIKPDVLIPADATGWMLDSLRATGVPEDRWQYWDGGRKRANRLIVSATRREDLRFPKARQGLYSQKALEWLRDRMKDRVEPEPTGGKSRRVYISRSGALKRRVVNESRVMDLLSEWGFERVRPEQLSFADQVRLFSNAEAIVAPHGAGLMNQLFADSAVVVELLGNKQTKTSPGVYYYYANLLGHQYGCVPGEAVGADIRADVTKLRILLERFLNGSGN